MIKGKKLYFINEPGLGFNENNRDALINKLKVFFKKYPKFFNFLYYTFGAIFVGKKAKDAINSIGKDKLILNLGSGVRSIRSDVINIDFYPFKEVGIVADIMSLPFKDSCVDAIVNESVLEHVKNPQAIVKEIHRVLKPGGLVYIFVPFVASFHSSPEDYYRWSKEGLREFLKEFFQEKEINIGCGPTSAMVNVLSEWLALLFSLGIKKLQQLLFIFFTILLSPLKLFDYLLYRLPNAENIAHHFYYIGYKK